MPTDNTPPPPRVQPTALQDSPPRVPRLLITAGPTHEPIDAVRFLGNRSSGRLGNALADHAADLGWDVRLLLGPTALTPRSSRPHLFRFRTTAELQALLTRHLAWCDVLIMAAAVADYRPILSTTDGDVPASASPHSVKLRRTDQPLTIRLEPTPDLLAACSKERRPGQVLVGFALEPSDRLMESARAKLIRKGLDLIVANPLETMDADTIDATALGADGSERRTPGPIPKADFAPWLLTTLSPLIAANLPLRNASPPSTASAGPASSG